MGNVLVVDDHAEGRYLLRCLLEAQGYTVAEAGNGKEALEMAARQMFDLVVSDILMPVMDGFALCRTWKSDPRLRTIPFVVYTATYVDKPDEELAKRLGADLFLVKPTEPEVFMARVREALGRHRAGALAARPPEGGEALLQQYNEVLVHKLEDKLAQLEEANRALRLKDLALASSRNGVVLTDGAGEVIYVNPPFLRMARLAAPEVMGKPVRGLFGQHPSFLRWLDEGEAAAPLELELAVTGTPVTVLWLRLERHAVSDEAGAALGLMLSCADITQERRLRQNLARIQRLEALGLFAAGVAHDFNNLLMAIFSVLEMDGTRPDAPATRQADRATAYAAFERARDLTRRLMSFANQAAAERRPVDLRQLLDESIALSLSGSSVRCDKRYCTTPAVASADPGQLAQVFSNLLVNARQAMQDRGRILASISVEPPHSPSGHGVVEVRIQDEGPGIPPDILPCIFEPYFTTKAEGTGLGLATSRAIVTEHGGRISAESPPGAGASFVVSLPAVEEQAPLVAPAPARLEGSGTERILVMEDRVAMQALLRCGLERAGYSIALTTSDEATVREFEQSKRAGRPFDLVLLAADAGRGTCGEEALAKLRRIEPAVVAIATTGDGGAAAALLDLGFARVVTKPFLLHELLATIRAVLPHAS